MKIEIQSIQEISPIILLSVLLFVSCTQLPIVEENADTAVAENIEVLPSEEESETIISETVIDQMDPIQMDVSEEELTIIENNLEESILEERDETQQELAEAIEVVEEELPSAEELARINEEMMIHQRNVEVLCEEIGSKLGSVSVEDCLIHELEFAGAYSVNARPLALRDFHPRSTDDVKTRVLVIGGDSWR